MPIQTGLTFASTSAYGYVIGFVDGVYTVNGSPMFPYAASTSGSPASYPLMTAPQMFTFGDNFYTFDVAETGAWVSVTGDGQTLPINPYQFSLNGVVYIIDTNVQPNTVTGGGSTVEDDGEQQPVRAGWRAVHHHAEGGLARRGDDFRAVQHRPGQCRRDRELSSTCSIR